MEDNAADYESPDLLTVLGYYGGDHDNSGLGILAQLPAEVLLLIGSFVTIDEDLFYRICCTSKAFALWFFSTIDNFTIRITEDYRVDSLFRLLPYMVMRYRSMQIITERPGILPELAPNLQNFECTMLLPDYEKHLKYCKQLTSLTAVKYYHSFVDTLAHLQHLTYLYLYGFDAWYYDSNFVENIANLNVSIFKTVVPFYVKPTFVSNMTRVTDLQLYSIDAPNLEKMTKLEKLYQFRIDSNVFKLTQLTALSVGSPALIKAKDKSLWDQLDAFSRLKRLEVTCDRNIPVPFPTISFLPTLQKLTLTNMDSIDVKEFLRSISACQQLRCISIEAEISEEDYSKLGNELMQRQIEFKRINTRHRYLVATKDDNSMDKYDFMFTIGEKGYLIEDHGNKLLLHKEDGVIGFVAKNKWKQIAE